MSAEDLEEWRATAATMPGGALSLNMPLDTFLGEAIDVANFHDKYWKARRNEEGVVVFPGLELGVGKGKHKKPIKSSTGKDIRSIRAAALHADTLYQLAQAPVVRAPAQEGRKVLGKLTSVLAWAFDDGVEDEYDTKLSNLEARHGEPSSHDALANALDAYATFADEVRDRIASFEIFDIENIARARLLAQHLRDAPARPTAGSDAAAALDLRNRLCQLLGQQVRLVRGAAAFVFQDHPEVRREATSAYLRRQRSTLRARAKKEGSGTPPAAEA